MRNYYMTIFLFVFASLCVIIGVTLTLKIALSNPVEMDDSYLQSYQKTDKNIAAIQQSEHLFLSRFNANFDDTNLTNNGGIVSLNIVNRENNASVSTMHINAKITRPDSTKFDQNLSFAFDGNRYTAKVAALPKLGRWQVKVQISEGNLSFFTTKEFRVN